MPLKSWIISARKHAKLTQAQLGEAIGVTKANISAWEKGRHQAGLDQINKIAEVTRYPEPMSAFFNPLENTKDNWSQWPFDHIDQEKIKSLSSEQALRIETAIILTATQFGIDIKKN